MMYYRLRRIGRRFLSDNTYEAPVLHFIYDFDYHVIAVDQPRERFATLWSLVRHPRILGRIPRGGTLRPWSRLSGTFVRRLQLEPEFVKTVILERLTKDGWKIQGTFHIQKGAVAYLRDKWTTPEPRLFGSLAAALAAAFEIEEVSVRPFLYGLNIGAAVRSYVLTTVAAVLFPVAVALLGNFLKWASRADLRLISEIFVAIVLITVAYAFFRLRISRQRLYGAIELGVGIGMVIAVIRAPQPSDRLELPLKVMASVYVMIRGLVNINDAVAKAREPLRAEAKTTHAAIMEGDESLDV
jgi:hypothetical protein